MIEFIKKNYSKLGMALALSMLVINYYQQRELAELRIKAAVVSESVAPLAGDIKINNIIDSLTNQNDLLKDELFIERVDAGRHELTREAVLGKYPKIAKEYDDFYTHQTE
jgi:hypothetical protein